MDANALIRIHAAEPTEFMHAVAREVQDELHRRHPGHEFLVEPFNTFTTKVQARGIATLVQGNMISTAVEPKSLGFDLAVFLDKVSKVINS